jgi:hypothetical protein
MMRIPFLLRIAAVLLCGLTTISIFAQDRQRKRHQHAANTHLTTEGPSWGKSLSRFMQRAVLAKWQL